jgi:hypothetical protein
VDVFLLAYLVLIGIACYFLFPGVMALSGVWSLNLLT